jgi:hypothetical protein
MLHNTTINRRKNKIKIPKIISELNGFGLLDNKTYCKIRELVNRLIGQLYYLFDFLIKII